MAGVVYDDLFLIIGGCASSGGYPVLNSVVALSNVTEKSWMHIAPMVERRSYHSCTIFPSLKFAENTSADRKVRSYDKYGRNEQDWFRSQKIENMQSSEVNTDSEHIPMIYCSGGYVGTKRLGSVERLTLSDHPEAKFKNWEIHSQLEVPVTQHTMMTYQDKMLGKCDRKQGKRHLMAEKLKIF